jgi:hypothetical protein
MVSKRIVLRVAQIVSVLVLGLWMQTAQARCFDCPQACSGSASCSQHQKCEQCPVAWWGSCYAGTEGCGYYDCDPTPLLCCSLVGGVCLDVCDCAPCPE